MIYQVSDGTRIVLLRFYTYILTIIPADTALAYQQLFRCVSPPRILAHLRIGVLNPPVMQRRLCDDGTSRSIYQTDILTLCTHRLISPVSVPLVLPDASFCRLTTVTPSSYPHHPGGRRSKTDSKFVRLSADLRDFQFSASLEKCHISGSLTPSERHSQRLLVRCPGRLSCDHV